MGPDLRFQACDLEQGHIHDIVAGNDGEHPVSWLFSRNQAIASCWEDSELQGFPTQSEIDAWVSAADGFFLVSQALEDSDSGEGRTAYGMMRGGWYGSSPQVT